MMRFGAGLTGGGLLTVALLAASQPPGNLENPSNGGFYGGIQTISGWVCDAEKLEILIDGTQYLSPAYGTERLDTRSVCGDADNGFGLLVNMSNLGTGEHEAVLFADGQEIDRTSFTVTALSTGEFATGLEACATISKFPAESSDLTLIWSEASQNFQIKEELVAASAIRLEGLWSNDLNDIYFWTSSNDASEGCSKDISLYASGYLASRSQMPEKIDLVGKGENGVFTMKSTGWDSVQREVRFELQGDGSMRMKTTKCPGPTICEKTPEGSVIFLTKVLDPFDEGYLPPLAN